MVHIIWWVLFGKVWTNWPFFGWLQPDWGLKKICIGQDGSSDFFSLESRFRMLVNVIMYMEGLGYPLEI